MENFLQIESCAFELSELERNFKFESAMNLLDIRLMEKSISNELYTEGVVENIKVFFNNIIEKIKEIFKKSIEAFNNKMLEMKLQHKMKEFKKDYAKYKTRLKGKKVKIFDYMKFYKEASDHIRDVHKAICDLEKKTFKNFEELKYYTEKIGKKIDWDVDNTDDDKYFFDQDLLIAIDLTDGYGKKICDTLNKVMDEIIKEEELIMQMAAKEAAEEKTDSDNVSKTSEMKTIANKLASSAKKISSLMPYFGWRCLSGICRITQGFLVMSTVTNLSDDGLNIKTAINAASTAISISGYEDMHDYAIKKSEESLEKFSKKDNEK